MLQEIILLIELKKLPNHGKRYTFKGQSIYVSLYAMNRYIFPERNFTSLGMNQRKVNILAREYSVDIKFAHKPIIVSNHMLKSLLNI